MGITSGEGGFNRQSSGARLICNTENSSSGVFGRRGSLAMWRIFTQVVLAKCLELESVCCDVYSNCKVMLPLLFTFAICNPWHFYNVGGLFLDPLGKLRVSTRVKILAPGLFSASHQLVFNPIHPSSYSHHLRSHSEGDEILYKMIIVSFSGRG